MAGQEHQLQYTGEQIDVLLKKASTALQPGDVSGGSGDGSGKLNEQQGVENAGKLLVIGSDGNVVPGELLLQGQETIHDATGCVAGQLEYGQLNSNVTGWNTTGFIPIPGGGVNKVELSFNAATPQWYPYGFYGSESMSDMIVGTNLYTPGGEVKLEIPAGAKYFRMSFLKSDMGAFWAKVKVSSVYSDRMDALEKTVESFDDALESAVTVEPQTTTYNGIDHTVKGWLNAGGGLSEIDYDETVADESIRATWRLTTIYMPIVATAYRASVTYKCIAMGSHSVQFFTADNQAGAIPEGFEYYYHNGGEAEHTVTAPSGARFVRVSFPWVDRAEFTATVRTESELSEVLNNKMSSELEKLMVLDPVTSTYVAEGLTYQWQWQAAAGGDWGMSGLPTANTANLQVPGTADRNGQHYRCAITNASGKTIYSDPVTLTVSAELSFAITHQPQSVEVAENEYVVFTVGAVGEGLTYQWYFMNLQQSEWQLSSMAGSTTSSIKVQATTTRNGYRYCVVITDASGNKLTSDPAYLTLRQGTTEFVVTKQPVDANVALGGTATFSVAVAGGGGLTVGRLNGGGTVDSSVTNFATTDFLPCRSAATPEVMMHVKVGGEYWYTWAFYDENKVEILNSFASSTFLGETDYTVPNTPENAVYFRACFPYNVGGDNPTFGFAVSITTMGELAARLGGDGAANFNYKAYEGTPHYGAYRLPVLYLEGDITNMSKDISVTLNYKYRHRTSLDAFVDKSGTLTCKWQGSSSLYFPKKNYTLKFDAAFNPKQYHTDGQQMDGTGWGNQKKFCLKANYIDASHARNIICARLWGQMVKSRDNTVSQLTSLPNGGAIDGFPILLVINGQYQGLYTWNIPKDQWLFGMGSGEKECFVCADATGNVSEYRQACQFRHAVTLTEDSLGETDFSIEYIPDENNISWAVTSMNKVINAVQTATSLNDVATLLDIESAVDHMCLVAFIGGMDNVVKNYNFGTYDGTKWFFSAYDMDGTLGNYWSGERYIKTGGYPMFTDLMRDHEVYNLIGTKGTDRLKARWQELREDVLSEDNLLFLLSNFLAPIPAAVKAQESLLWPKTPGSYTGDIGQITAWARLRLAKLDAEIAGMTSANN